MNVRENFWHSDTIVSNADSGMSEIQDGEDH